MKWIKNRFKGIEKKKVKGVKGDKEFIKLVVMDCLAVVSKGTAMLCVEVDVTSEFSGSTFGYGLKLAGI